MKRTRRRKLSYLPRGARALLRRRRAAGALLLTATVGPGCYGYHRADLAGIQPGEQVRVILEDRAYQEIAPGAQDDLSRRLEGNFVRMTGDSVALSVWIGQAYRGTPFYSAHQTVTVPGDQVVAFERREISKVRTALAAAGILGAIVIFISQVEFTPDPNPGEERPPTDPPEPSGNVVPGTGGFDLIRGIRALLSR